MWSIGWWKNREIVRKAGMNAEAHQEAIPACAATWKTTRYLMEGDQSIGRRGESLSTYLPESPSGLGATLRPDDAFDAVLEGGEGPSCAIVDDWAWVGGGERRRGVGETCYDL